MLYSYNKLIKEIRIRLSNCCRGSVKETTHEGTDDEYFFNWEQLDNDDRQLMEMQIRLALFEDYVLIETWQDRHRRSVCVKTLDQGIIVVDYFINITVL
tara:strand:- start:1220 stop:1516 length:297 start_codon:yes stop_codon:yes gene_type:complete